MPRLRRWLLVVIAAVCVVNTACALDPSKAISQYVRDKWGADRGFVGGAVFAISQSRDGYLWIGTERGLVRFDGLDFTLIQNPLPGSSQIGAVRGLAADSDGNLWIRLDGPHLLRYRDGKFEDAMVRFGLQEIAFTAMSLDSQGKLLLWGPQRRLLRFREGAFSRYEIAEDVPGIVISTAEESDGKLWLGTRDIGLFQIDKGHSRNISGPLALTSINTVLAATRDGVWIGTDSGLKFWNRNGLSEPDLPPSIKRLQILALTKDRDGNVWVGTPGGLVRIIPAPAFSAELVDHSSGNPITAVYEDRDGGIWFGGPRGVERLRDGMFTGYSAAQGLPPKNNGPIYVDSDGTAWFAPASGGLFWLKEHRVGHVNLDGLDKDVVYSISGGDGEIWVGRQHGGLTVLRLKGDSSVARTYTQANGLAQNSIYSVHRNRDGTVWAGSVTGGISRLSKGVFTNYSVEDGLASNAVFSIVEGNDGKMWFATPGGLESFTGEHWKNYELPTEIGLSSVRSLFEDSKRVLWIATSSGPAFITSDRIEVPAYLPDPLREDIFGIAEDKLGTLWFVTSDHVLQVPRDKLLAGSVNDTDVLSYGTEDGLPGVEGVRRDRSVATDSDGRIWISLAQGLASAQPATVANTAGPVSVRMESISAEGRPVSFANPPMLAAGSRNITFNYADSNLAIPQRIKFRYRLDGSGQGWSSDVALRQVMYTNLGPGAYRFHIMASNGLGMWNGPETVVSFEIEPAFWQAWWFRVVCFAAFCLAVIAIYQVRVSQLAHQLNVRFQDRLAERTRIAQDLHDTLLQGVLSASMQLDVVEDQTPDDSPSKPLLKRILQLMGQVTEEGRSALRGLRAPESNTLSLETALSRLREEFPVGQMAEFQVITQGSPRPLSPMIRDEVYRIGREAVVNAFLHAKANKIELEVEYARTFVRVLVSDDGCGIDQNVLDIGRAGHWGLPGMRERSEKIGATLKLRSRTGAGTEVQLTVPGAIAFDGQSPGKLSRLRLWPMRKKTNTRTNDTEKRGRQ
jgi:signal transduction histidine kinase/ligand-binding sensor domain-containing protein